MMFNNQLHMRRFNAWMTLYTILRVIGLAWYLPALYKAPLILILSLPSYIALTLQLMGWCQKNWVRFERGCKIEGVLVRVLLILVAISRVWPSPNSEPTLIGLLVVYHPAILWFLLCQAYDNKDTVEWIAVEDKDAPTTDTDTPSDQSSGEQAVASDASLIATASSAEKPDASQSSYLYPLMGCKVFVMMIAIMMMEADPLIALVLIMTQLAGMCLINTKRPEGVTLAQYVEVVNMMVVFGWLISGEGQLVAMLRYLVIPTLGLSLILPMLLLCISLILLDKYKRELKE